MNQKNLPTLNLSAEHMTAEEQYSTWRTCIQPFFDAQPANDAKVEQYSAESTWYLLDNIVMAQTFFSASNFHRNQKWLAQHDDSDHFVFPLFVQGSYMGVNGKRDFRSDLGSITAVDMAKEVYSQSTKSELLSVVIPRDRMKNSDKLHGIVLPGASVKAKVLREHMLTLWKSLPDIEIDENPSFSEGLIGLFNALFSQDDALDEEESRILNQSLLESIKNHIEQNLRLEELGVESLCRRFHCSRATLYRLFQDDGGVANYIKERRLVATFRMLIKPSSAKQRIMDVAAEYGFNNQSSFSRLFRERFAAAPSDVVAMDTSKSMINVTRQQSSTSSLSSPSQQSLTAERAAQWLWSLR